MKLPKQVIPQPLPTELLPPPLGYVYAGVGSKSIATACGPNHFRDYYYWSVNEWIRGTTTQMADVGRPYAFPANAFHSKVKPLDLDSEESLKAQVAKLDKEISAKQDKKALLQKSLAKFQLEKMIEESGFKIGDYCALKNYNLKLVIGKFFIVDSDNFRKMSSLCQGEFDTAKKPFLAFSWNNGMQNAPVSMLCRVFPKEGETYSGNVTVTAECVDYVYFKKAKKDF